DVQVRQGVARNPAAPEELLIRLAWDPAVEVRLAVANHPTAPKEALRALTSDREPLVWAALSRRTSA
ncbi:MAG TPA: hypothetical protein PKW90_14525, partial [Myxococcota bacterium]|nr:hypothetical protein [Myxococcota bacterium]